MFSELTLRELDKLWKMLESSVYHQADFYGTLENQMQFEHSQVFWDVSCEMDSRST